MKHYDSQKKLLEEIKFAVSYLRPFKAIVFGSFAYGTPHKDSNLDIFVILNKFGNTEQQKQNFFNRNQFNTKQIVLINNLLLEGQINNFKILIQEE